MGRVKMAWEVGDLVFKADDLNEGVLYSIETFEFGNGKPMLKKVGDFPALGLEPYPADKLVPLWIQAGDHVCCSDVACGTVEAIYCVLRLGRLVYVCDVYNSATKAMLTAININDLIPSFSLHDEKRDPPF